MSTGTRRGPPGPPFLGIEDRRGGVEVQATHKEPTPSPSTPPVLSSLCGPVFRILIPYSENSSPEMIGDTADIS